METGNDMYAHKKRNKQLLIFAFTVRIITIFSVHIVGHIAAKTDKLVHFLLNQWQDNQILNFIRSAMHFTVQFVDIYFNCSISTKYSHITDRTCFIICKNFIRYFKIARLIDCSGPCCCTCVATNIQQYWHNSVAQNWRILLLFTVLQYSIIGKFFEKQHHFYITVSLSESDDSSILFRI